MSTKVLLSSEDSVVLKQVELANVGEDDVLLDVMSVEQVILATKDSFVAHPAYQGLFLNTENFEGNALVEKRFQQGEKLYYMHFAFVPQVPEMKFELELDQLKIVGRGRSLENPVILEQDKMFSNEIISCANLAVALKKTVELKKEEKLSICFYSMVAESPEEMRELYEKYRRLDAGERMLELAKSRAQIENRFLGFRGKEILRFHELLGNVLEEKEGMVLSSSGVSRQVCHGKQSDLWKYGISGDLPLMVVCLHAMNEVFLLQEYVRASLYFHHKKIGVDLVVIFEDAGAGESYYEDRIMEMIYKENAHFLLHQRGGIHVIRKTKQNAEDMALLMK